MRLPHVVTWHCLENIQWPHYRNDKEGHENISCIPFCNTCDYGQSANAPCHRVPYGDRCNNLSLLAGHTRREFCLPVARSVLGDYADSCLLLVFLIFGVPEYRPRADRDTAYDGKQVCAHLYEKIFGLLRLRSNGNAKQHPVLRTCDRSGHSATVYVQPFGLRRRESCVLYGSYQDRPYRVALCPTAYDT
jgi:hypothetical protein